MYVAEKPLESYNTVPGGCGQCVFTGCRKMLLEKLGGLIIDGNLVADTPVAFWDADGEVHFSWICVNKEGSLRAVLRNYWNDGKGGGGYYSILPYAKTLTIFGASQAVMDLVSYIRGVHWLDERW